MFIVKMQYWLKYYLFLLMLFISVQAIASSNANITLEVKKIDNIYAALQKITSENKIIVKSYYEHSNRNRIKKALSITYDVPENQIIEVMGKIALLGNVQYQNYNENELRKEDVEAKRKMLGYYKTQLDKVIISGTGIPEVISQLNYKIQSLEKEITEYEKQNVIGSGPKVKLNLQIKEQGYDNDNEYEQNNKLSKTYILIITIVLLIIVILTFLAGMYKGRTNSSKKKHK